MHFLNETIWIAIHMLPKFAPKDQIDNIPSLVKFILISMVSTNI